LEQDQLVLVRTSLTCRIATIHRVVMAAVVVAGATGMRLSNRPETSIHPPTGVGRMMQNHNLNLSHTLTPNPTTGNRNHNHNRNHAGDQ
jgi:hypothetical protein